MIQAQYPPEPILQKHISLTLESDLPCISIRLRRPVPSDSLREIHQQALRGLASGPRSQLLCDLSGLETFTLPDQQWFTRQWLPQTARAVTVTMELRGVIVFVTGELVRAQQWLESLGKVTQSNQQR